METGRVLYRILTKKSLMKFGRYADLTVADVIAFDPTYIPYAYFNCSNISFCKEILEEFKLPELAKPGKYEKEFKQWRYAQWNERRETMSEGDYMHTVHKEKQHVKRVQRAINVKKSKRAERGFTKGVMQARNHGHIK